ncbi:MAG TPA: hypothetical protein VEW69_06035 [Alphaproteobacteria bacterium]|nr:hypothetical protein [Alphaproteobacteria bacterium]
MSEPESVVPPSQPASLSPITKELDTARITPMMPLLLGLVTAAVVVGVILLATQAKAARGTVIKVVGVGQDKNTIVAIQVKVDNLTGTTMRLGDITCDLETADGTKLTDRAAPASDVPHYLQAVPELAEAKAELFDNAMKIPPKGSFTGVTVFSFPVDKAGFDARKTLALQIEVAGRSSLTVKEIKDK